MLAKFDYIRPNTVKEAIHFLADENTVAHAGGTDLLGCLREHIFEAKTVVSLSRLRELQGIQKTKDGGLRIGALTTLTEIGEDQLVRETWPGLARAALEVASPQLRNQGTIGGNLCQKPRCWYYRGEFQCLRKGGNECFAEHGENVLHCIFGGENCFIVHPSDTAPALAALEASVHTEGPKGQRTLPVEGFHVPPRDDFTRETVLEPGEIVTEIVLPPPPVGLRSSYRKVRARRSWDFALAGVALAIVLEGDRVSRARVFLSGAAPVPWRSKEVEEIITGKPLTQEIIKSASLAVVKGARPLEQNGYKVPLFRSVMEEELQSVLHPAK
ncbi:MAG: xanthine dehydrogenase family protein subunit M [Syntrophobacter sp.]